MKRFSLILTYLALAVVFVIVFAADDYYKLLGLQRDASQSEIKRAFRRISMKEHPDKGGDPEKYAKISHAYDVLSDEEKRRNYDQFGDENGPQGGGGGFDPFGDFFGGGFGGFRFNTGGGSQRREQMPNVRIPVEATLEDLYNGRKFSVTQSRQHLCHHCRGTGADDPNDIKQCTACGGTGMRVRTIQRGPGFVQHIQSQCDVCGGKGKVVSSTCHHCHGSKVEPVEELLNVWIEKGMADGSVITFPQHSDERPEWNPGDVEMYIKTLPHARFTRKGNDLSVVQHVSLLQALTGFEIDVEHLDKHMVHVARTEVTPPNFVLKVPGEGMPIHSTPSIHGDLYIEFIVDFPKSITKEQSNAFKELLSK